MKSKKVSVYHSPPPQSMDEKRVFVLKGRRGSVLPREDVPEMKSAASSVRHAADTTVLMCGVKPGSVSATTERKKFRHVVGTKVHFKSRMWTIKANQRSFKAF